MRASTVILKMQTEAFPAAASVAVQVMVAPGVQIRLQSAVAGRLHIAINPSRKVGALTTAPLRLQPPHKSGQSPE
jgi:hypothetical protein